MVAVTSHQRIGADRAALHDPAVLVRLAYGPDRAQLTVEDRARPGAGRTGKCGSGYGLTGMREPARLLGGNLHAAATDAGFRVELEVPL